MATSRLHRVVLGCLGALALGAVTGCVTPTIPIPPPEPEKIAFQVDTDLGVARFTYDAFPSYANAIVYVFNRDGGTGVITTAEPDGSVAPTDPFAGQAGDEVVVTFELDGDLGSTCVTLQNGQSSSANECSP
jgi:hypothetical protein